LAIDNCGHVASRRDAIVGDSASLMVVQHPDSAAIGVYAIVGGVECQVGTLCTRQPEYIAGDLPLLWQGHAVEVSGCGLVPVSVEGQPGAAGIEHAQPNLLIRFSHDKRLAEAVGK